MTEGGQLDKTGARKAIRPVLIVSRRNIAEHAVWVQRLLVGLADESITTALVCPADCDMGQMVPVPADIFTHPLVNLPLMEHLGVEQLAVKLEKFKPTVLHCLCESRAALVRRLARRLDVPYVLAVNSLARKFLRLSISPRRCTNIVVPAETIRSSAVRAHLGLAERIRQINMGTFVDPEPTCFSDSSRLSSIVVVHPLNRASDFAGLLKAAEGLVADGHEFMMVIMGSGRAEHRLRKLLADYGLSEVVMIVPPLEACRSVLATGDIFVQPQPTTAFSVTLLEAMGLGAAVVACAGGVDDLIVPNQTALVFDPDHEQSIRQCLVRLLDDHGYARRLAGTAQTYVAGRYSVGEMISATLEAYSVAPHQYDH